jgi:hypothetical protein
MDKGHYLAVVTALASLMASAAAWSNPSSQPVTLSIATLPARLWPAVREPAPIQRSALHQVAYDLPELGGARPPPNAYRALAHSFKTEGLPLATLWKTKKVRLAIGLNRRGVPGVWFVRCRP